MANLAARLVFAIEVSSRHAAKTVRSIQSSERPYELPLWIAQFPLALGALLFALQSMTRFTRVLWGEAGEDETLRVGQEAFFFSALVRLTGDLSI